MNSRHAVAPEFVEENAPLRKIRSGSFQVILGRWVGKVRRWQGPHGTHNSRPGDTGATPGRLSRAPAGHFISELGNDFFATKLK